MEEREWEYYIQRKQYITRFTEEPLSVFSIWQKLLRVVKEEQLAIADTA
jgi:hypothetical protein